MCVCFLPVGCRVLKELWDSQGPRDWWGRRDAGGKLDFLAPGDQKGKLESLELLVDQE